MSFWENMSPVIRRSLMVGVVVLLGLLAAQYFAAAPLPNVTSHRGVGGTP